MTNKLTLVDHGVMLSDYFSGTSGVWLNINIDKHTTFSQIIGDLEMEVNTLHEHIEFTAEHHNFSGDIFAQLEKEIEEIKENCKDKLSDAAYPSLEFEFSDDDEFAEYPVLVITVEFTEE